MQPEPVSPELVLIDPELARRERARLEEKAYLKSVLDVAALRRAVETELPPADETVPRSSYLRDAASFSKRRLLPAALMCSLLANGFLVADLVGRKGEEAAQVAVRMVTLTESAPTTAPSSSVPTAKAKASPSVHTAKAKASPSVHTAKTKTSHGQRVATPTLATKSAVERKVVSLILSAPAGKLPRNFLDPTTGLVKNNVQVVCSRKQRSFLCAVRLPSAVVHNTLYVRYRTNKNGDGVFKWYGYRRS